MPEGPGAAEPGAAPGDPCRPCCGAGAGACPSITLMGSTIAWPPPRPPLPLPPEPPPVLPPETLPLLPPPPEEVPPSSSCSSTGTTTTGG